MSDSDLYENSHDDHSDVDMDEIDPDTGCHIESCDDTPNTSDEEFINDGEDFGEIDTSEDDSVVTEKNIITYKRTRKPDGFYKTHSSPELSEDDEDTDNYEEDNDIGSDDSDMPTYTADLDNPPGEE